MVIAYCGYKGCKEKAPTEITIKKEGKIYQRYLCYKHFNKVAKILKIDLDLEGK